MRDNSFHWTMKKGPMTKKIVFTKLNKEAISPERNSKGAAGYDLYALKERQVNPLGFTQIPTGIAMSIPSHLMGEIRARSGLAQEIEVFAGTIDSDYRGEILILAKTRKNKIIHIKEGDRIAQIVFTRIETPELEEVQKLTKTERGEDGFGSTGK